MTTLKRVMALFSLRERRQLYWLIPGMIVMALVEVLGIASITPFLALLSKPEVLESNVLLSRLYQAFPFKTPERFLIFIGLGVLMALTFSNGFSMVMTWVLFRFTWLRNHSIGRRLLASYLHRPYSFFLGRNTSELSATLFAEVQHIVLDLLIPGMRMASRLVVALFILIFLVYFDPLLALITFAVLGSAYGAIFYIVRRKLSKLGQERVTAQRKSYKIAGEALSGIKDIKLLGKEQDFLERFSLPSSKYARGSATSFVIAHIPKYALEIVAFGGILVIVLYYLVAKGGIQDVLPMVGLYAFASYRLLPAMQSIFEALTKMQVNFAMLDNIHRDLEQEHKLIFSDRAGLEPLAFEREIELKHLSYSYLESQEAVLKDLNLTIQANTSVAFVGATGSGKTTTVDLILGLLSPTSGAISVDGVRLDQVTLAAWQKQLGYVSQQIYLSDDSILNNIAFGVSTEQLDKDAAIRAAKIANVHDFIMSLPEGYETVVGERGVRLSGGQRQRLGIARALYHDPKVLILDEATSALDNLTEELVFEAIEALGKTKTIIMIAHRLTTVRDCDIIYLMEQGSIISHGSYDELVHSSTQFATMAQVKPSKLR